LKEDVMKTVARNHRDPVAHWVGDGFPVHSLFSYWEMGEELSPFLLLDHLGPAEFPPARERRGVGFHPHRGFETVTLVYEGEVEHRDSAGNSGRIGPGDVQWMTAASGVVHEEMHSQAFTERGGLMHGVQLWVNLPAMSKMTPPRYQTLMAGDIPSVPLPGGRARIVAGSLEGAQGPAQTVTPVGVWDLELAPAGPIELAVPSGHTAALVTLEGRVRAGGTTTRPGDVTLFTRDGSGVQLEAEEASKLLLLSGAPIAEPIVGHGPFVMNTKDEIVQAYADFRSGRF
jgi:redox-sensitive bicupin YhaK (pirin superfamily)